MMARKESSQTVAAPAGALIGALRRVLRPLVRLLLHQRVTYPLLKDLLKEVYVEVADREFGLEGRAPTNTRIALLTGVHRKDVKRLLEAGEGDAAAPPAASLGAQLVGRWLDEEAYLDAKGRPKPLPRRAGPGEPSFEALVESTSKDLRSRTVLDEWLRLGVAELDDEDRVVLQVDAFVPEKGFDEKAFFFGRNLADHVGAAAHNLGGGAPPMLERAVYYEGLSPDSVAKLRTLSRELGSRAISEVNHEARALARGDGDGPRRMAFGVYFYETDTEEGGEAGDA